MNESEGRRPIVVRRKRPSREAGAHGTWKIAYADFMTAMMAFFLVMWLLGGLSKTQLDQVSKYFRTPLKVALVGGDKATASDSAIPGGGDNPIHSDGQVALTRPQARNYRPDHRHLEELKQRLEQMIKQDPALNDLSSQLKIRLVSDGLQIQIFDNKRKPMFELGSARIEPYIKTLLVKIAPKLNSLPNKITLTGHTDDLPYASGPDSYGNWELSSDRANAARRALMAGGLKTGKLLRVIGASDTLQLPGDSPGAPTNRRISILVLNDRAEHRIESQNREEEMPEPARPALPTHPRSLQAATGNGRSPLRVASSYSAKSSTGLWPGASFGLAVPKVMAGVNDRTP